MARMDDDDLLDLEPGAPLKGSAYRVSKKLGAGGMGAVYEGEHVRLKRRVCIKIIHPGMRGRTEFLERMDREAQTLARLDHPGIVKVFDLGVTDDGIPYFVMERLEGKDLRRLLTARRFFALPDALAIMKDVLEALAHAHTEGIVHRDVKPENVFLALAGADAVTKVLDFGIAHVADDPRALTGQRFLGTCQYAAPEQLQGHKPTERTDIYAAGCMLFELVAGRRPFPGPKANDFIRQHLQDTAPLLSTFVSIPSALDELVASALSKDPSRRPISALWFAAQLHQLSQIAEDVVLATANTTQEMLLTAVTQGADSSRPPEGAAPKDTVRDAALPFGVGATAPAKGGVIGRQQNTVPLALATAPLDMRLAGTREAPAIPRLRTEELSEDEHHVLEGRAKTPAGSGVASRSSSSGARAAAARAAISPHPSSTTGAVAGELAPAGVPRRLGKPARLAVIASPIVVAVIAAAAILILGSKTREPPKSAIAAATQASAVGAPATVAAASGTASSVSRGVEPDGVVSNAAASALPLVSGAGPSARPPTQSGASARAASSPRQIVAPASGTRDKSALTETAHPDVAPAVSHSAPSVVSPSVAPPASSPASPLSSGGYIRSL